MKRTMIVQGVPSAGEQYYCNFGVNPDYVALLKRAVGKDKGHEG
jgi:hypothetical protein